MSSGNKVQSKVSLFSALQVHNVSGCGVHQRFYKSFRGVSRKTGEFLQYPAFQRNKR